MANFAVLDLNNQIVNVVSADTLIVAEEVTNSKCIEYSDSEYVVIGMYYDDYKEQFVDQIIE